MSAAISAPISGLQSGSIALGSRMEAATEALLRIRDEVVSSLDRQVVEMQQLHRALAYAPPPMTVTEDMPTTAAMPTAASPPDHRPSFFEHAPNLVLASAPPNISHAPQSAASRSQVVEMVVATIDEPGMSLAEATLDPLLERATLEELNDALASAFAMVSSRSRQ